MSEIELTATCTCGGKMTYTVFGWECSECFSDTPKEEVIEHLHVDVRDFHFPLIQE